MTISPQELFNRCHDLAFMKGDGHDVNRLMHETLAMTCAEATARMGQSFGNLFAQVDFLCKQCGVSLADKIAIQTMRRHSNKSERLTDDDFMYDLRALCVFISAVFKVDIPHKLTTVIPHTNRPQERLSEINQRYLRCVVDRWDNDTIYATVDDEQGGRPIEIDYSNHDYLRRMLTDRTQLNLLDNHVDGNKVKPLLIVLEPDFLLDISSIAACFSDYGHHPLTYTISRLRPRANSQAILLGNFASSALDDIINNANFDVKGTITNSFKEQALQFCSCNDFDPHTFKQDAEAQAKNITEAVATLFANKDRQKAILEPSFVCERLGLQGRVDLMTTDMHLLVEQKSGKNRFIAQTAPTGNPLSRYIESHYVQLLLYYGVLRYNFNISADNIDMRLLYSKYPARQGLIVVNFYRQLFLEAIKLRNRIVGGEYAIARMGFGSITGHLNADSINERNRYDSFFYTYIRPQTEAVTAPLHHLSTREHAYFTRMATFVYREQIAQRVGAQEGVSSSMADLWNMPLAEKIETGNIYTRLTITSRQRSNEYNGFDLITLTVPDQGEDFLPNFRRGDFVYLYRYDGQPDVRRNILYKGVMCEIENQRIVIRLNDGQQNASLFDSGTYAVEHGSSDIATSASLRSLHAFITAPQQWRNLLLCQREPQADNSLTLSKSYNPTFDETLLRAKQARDYFLLVGPPGTGKTSMALRFIVEEELASSESNILITAYTNRAVDEICDMLFTNGIDFMRLGNDSSCDPRFRSHLIDAAIDCHPSLTSIRKKIEACRIIVGTTSTLLSRPFVFSIKTFSLTIVDEASQILEPNIVGLLTSRFILIGDYKQLPAVVTQSEKESYVNEPLLRDIGLTDCRNSLFERLIKWERANGRRQFVGILRRQGRMHPDIAQFPNEMFYHDEHLVPVPCQHQKEQHINYTEPSIDHLDDVLKQRRMLFLPVDAPADGGGQKSNRAEAWLVADILRRIHRFYAERFSPVTTVGVIVPYRNQIAMIRREIAKLNIPTLLDISIDTVERYQGSQRDVIIYSFTVTRPFQLSFLTSNTFMENGRPIDRKLNVAITRARRQMIMVGCPDVLNHNTLFAELIKRYG